jgi:predicted nuclease of predicted toxin-antitoxin system
MKILANAHISRAIFGFLTSLGHDCVHTELVSPGMPDDDLLQLAVGQRRIILTADKDFGDLVYRRGLPAVGIILLRLRAATEAERLKLVQVHWAAVERTAEGYFVVVTNRRVRRSPLPTTI